MKTVPELLATADRAGLEYLAARDLILIDEDTSATHDAKTFAAGVEMALRWAAGNTTTAGSPPKTQAEIRQFADEIRVATLDNQPFPTGVEMGLRWAAGDTPTTLPDDLFPVVEKTRAPQPVMSDAEFDASLETLPGLDRRR